MVAMTPRAACCHHRQVTRGEVAGRGSIAAVGVPPEGGGGRRGTARSPADGGFAVRLVLPLGGGRQRIQ